MGASLNPGQTTAIQEEGREGRGGGGTEKLAHLGCFDYEAHRFMHLVSVRCDVDFFVLWPVQTLFSGIGSAGGYPALGTQARVRDSSSREVMAQTVICLPSRLRSLH